jgi:hypothetical protein
MNTAKETVPTVMEKIDLLDGKLGEAAELGEELNRLTKELLGKEQNAGDRNKRGMNGEAV